MLPREVNTEDALAFRGTQRYVIPEDAPDLRDLHEVTELVGLAVQICHGCGHVLLLDEEF